MLDPNLIIPDSFKLCFTYEQQILYLLNWISELSDRIGDEDSPAVKELQEEMEQVQREITELRTQLFNTTADTETNKAAIETMGLQLSDISDRLETLEETIENLPGGVSVDPTPTQGSNNPVSSGGTYDAIAMVEQLAESGVTLATEANQQAEDNASIISSLTQEVSDVRDIAEEALEKQSTPGEPGAPGAAAGFGTVTATVDDSTGTPSVDVVTDGPDTAKNISFSFHNLKGEGGSGGTALTRKFTPGKPVFELSNGKLVSTTFPPALLFPDYGSAFVIDNIAYQLEMVFGSSGLLALASVQEAKEANQIAVAAYIGSSNFLTVCNVLCNNGVLSVGKSSQLSSVGAYSDVIVFSVGGQSYIALISSSTTRVVTNTFDGSIKFQDFPIGGSYVATNGYSILIASTDGTAKLLIPKYGSAVSNTGYPALSFEEVDVTIASNNLTWLGHDGSRYLYHDSGVVYALDDLITGVGAEATVAYTLDTSPIVSSVNDPTIMCTPESVSVKNFVTNVWTTYTKTEVLTDSENTRYGMQGNNILAVTDTTMAPVISIGGDPLYAVTISNPFIPRIM